jgi:hypothetical protein
MGYMNDGYPVYGECNNGTFALKSNYVYVEILFLCN